MKSFLELVEEKQQGEKHHVMTFGRMNPPTTGHLKLIDKVKEVAKEHNASHSVVTSHSQDSKKNPLSGAQKVKHLKRYSPGTHFETSNKEHPTFLHHAAEQHKKGVTHLHMVVGSDRVKEMKEKLHKYNGTHEGALYNFKKIRVHSAGHRDPDAEGTTGMSGSKMRDAASEKRFHDVKDKTGKVVKPGFRSGVPGHVSDEHAQALMHDTRKGMGLHEDVNRGKFRAIFVTGGPGSGKDVIIREAISESRIVELNFVQAQEYLADKQKLSEKTNDFRRESIRNRGPLIINGPADDTNRISQIKEELEDLGYDTMMIFVNTTNETSKERNSLLSRMMMESIRHDKWLKSQENTKYFTESFNTFISFDNTGDIDSKRDDITEIYQSTNEFLDSEVVGETAEDWLNRRSQLNVGLLFKENKNVQKTTQFVQNRKSIGTKKFLNDNNSPVMQVQRKLGKIDDVRDGDVASNSGYTFRTYEQSQPQVKVSSPPKESNFQKDKDKEKRLKFGDKSISATRAGNADGVGSEWNTRTNGSGLTGGAGLGNQTYSECDMYSNASPASNAMPSGGSPNPLSGDYNVKDFKKFRKTVKKEAIDDPGACDMGVGGTLNGATNKEPLVTPNDNKVRSTDVLKKNKKKSGE
jgi:predicted kinase